MAKHLFAYSIFLLALTVALPASADSRKRQRKNTTEEPMLVEPDQMVLKANKDRSAVIVQHTHTTKVTVNTKYREGIDVSRYQGTIDWDQVASENEISYAYMKATEGATLVDVTYYRNIREARRVGLSVGSYHFYRPNIDWQVQFENMTSVVKKEDQDLIPIIDIEHFSGSHDEFIGNLKAFIEKVTAYYGKKPLLYTFHNFYNKHLVGEFKGYEWMIARYRSDEPTLNDGTDFMIWQYSSTGRISGIRGNVDRSRLMGDHSLVKLQM